MQETREQDESNTLSQNKENICALNKNIALKKLINIFILDLFYENPLIVMNLIYYPLLLLI